MKKTLVIIIASLLAISLLTFLLLKTFGNPETNNEESGNNDKTAKLINCSSLITREDVGQILGVDMLDDENEIIDLEDRLGGYIECVYNSEAYTYQIFLYQDALLSKDTIENGGTAWVFRNFVDGYNNNEKWRDYIITVEGIGEEAYLTDMTGMERWSLNILQSGYRIDMIITYNPLNHTPFDGENEWKVERLKELGKLAVKRLKSSIR